MFGNVRVRSLCFMFHIQSEFSVGINGYGIFIVTQPGALSIQPKILEISVGTSNGTDHFGLVRPEYSGPALKVVHFDRSGYLGRSD